MPDIILFQESRTAFMVQVFNNENQVFKKRKPTRCDAPRFFGLCLEPKQGSLFVATEIRWVTSLSDFQSLRECPMGDTTSEFPKLTKNPVDDINLGISKSYGKIPCVTSPSDFPQRAN